VSPVARPGSKFDGIRGSIDPDKATGILETGKATLYMRGEFLGNIHRIECTAARITVGPYAQHTGAVSALWVPRGKRAVRGTVQGYRPSLLVLEGWDHPAPDSPFVHDYSADGVDVSRGRHSACSDGWQSDFDRMIDAYLAKGTALILADHRSK
jgi:hypothetical protein